MTCSKCGGSVPEGAGFCAACGQPAISSTLPVSEYGSRTAARSVAYAGFWLRLVAFVIDWAVVSFVFSPILFLLFLRSGLITVLPAQPPDEAKMLENAGTVFAAQAMIFVLTGLYYSLLESSAWQATLGKRALGLMVTDLHGGRISFGRATVRYFAKILSGFTLSIGYVMAGFTERKQALHDMIANCLVVRKA